MTLRDYQVPIVERASAILYEHEVCLLALEPRLGKTFCSFHVAQSVGARKVLFITPKKAIPSIEDDYNTMKKDNPYIFDIFVTNIEWLVALFKKAEKQAEEIVLLNNPNVSKTGIKFKRLVKEEKTRIIPLLCNYLTGDVDLIIVDECHRQGAFPKPSIGQQTLRTIAEGKRVMLLSGTPNPESHSQFFNEFAISSFSPWSAYPSFYAWAKAGYVNVKDKMVNGIKIADYSDGNAKRILGDLAPYMISLTQVEAGFSTIIDERIINLRMNEQTLFLIKRLKRDRVIMVQGHEIAAGTPADYLNKVHQLTGGTIKISETEAIITDRTKACYLKNTFSGRHFAIFYVYKEERTLLLDTFTNVTEDWQTFQSDPSTIFIGQIRSIREGIKLDTAEFSVFYSTEYSYVSYKQGINRIVSKERTTPAIVYFMTSNCHMEQMILDCVHNKKDFTLATYNNH